MSCTWIPWRSESRPLSTLNLALAIFGCGLLQSSAKGIAFAVKHASAQLQTHLSASDLNLSRFAFAKRVASLAAASKPTFEVDTRESIGIERVVGPDPEWILNLRVHSTDKSDVTRQELAVAYWAGLRSGRVRVQALPSNDDDMVGPMNGMWRRFGRMLVGAGIDESYHSPTWADAEIEVFTEEPRGPTLKQRMPIAHSMGQVRFVNSRGSDIISHEAGEFQTLVDRKFYRPTCVRLYKLRHGRYDAVRSRTLHNELWATDQIVTDIRFHDLRHLIAFVPDAHLRRKLTTSVERLLRNESDLLVNFDAFDNSSDVTLLLGWNSPSIRIHLIKKGNQWRVTRADWISARSRQ